MFKKLFGFGRKKDKEAQQEVEELEECFDTLIILAHLKDKLLEKDGKEMTERGIDLIGKSASILSANVDAIGYMYREDNKTLVNFKPSESVTCGSRCDHLKDHKEIVKDIQN